MRRQKLPQISGYRAWITPPSSIRSLRPPGCPAPPAEISITMSPGCSSRAAKCELLIQRSAAFAPFFRSQSRNSVPRTTLTGMSPSAGASSPHSPPILWTTRSASQASTQPSGRALPSRARLRNGRSSKTVNSASPHGLWPFRGRLARQGVADALQIAEGCLQPCAGLLDQVFRFGKVIVVERFVTQPFEAVDLEIARADLADGERPPAVFDRFDRRPVASIRVGTVARLERLEV